MPYVNESRRAFTAGEGLPAYRLAKLDAGKAVLNTSAAADEPLGATERPAASGESVSLRLLNTAGTLEIEAGEAVAVGDDLVAADEGMLRKLPAAAGEYRRVGKALQAAPAGGGVIEVIPYAYTTTVTVAG